MLWCCSVLYCAQLLCLTSLAMYRLKEKIEGVLNTDRTVRLVVQLEAALHDSRLEVSCPCKQVLAQVRILMQQRT